MTTDVNYNNNSNNDAPSSEDFNFKGFPYVISVLISEKFPITEENKDQFSGKLRNIIDNINKLIGDNNTTLHILTNPNSNEFISENIVEENSNFCISVPNCNPNNNKNLPTNEFITEYIAQHSHLMIILGSGTIEEILRDDKDIKWIIQYKIEGYPGSNSQQGQAEKVTYPAVGPVLFIDDEQSYYFPSRNSITEEKAEVSPTHIRIFDNDNIDTHKTNSFDPSKQDEIYNNIRILKKINSIIKSDYDNKIKNKNTENYNNSDDLNIDSLSYKSKTNDTKFANDTSPETPEEIQPLIKYYHVINHCADKYKNWTSVSINIFCTLLFLVLIFNAVLIYLNDICITSVHTNAIQITQRYIYNNNTNYKWFMPLMEPLKFFIRNNPSTNVNAKTYITISSTNINDNEQQLPCLFIFYLTLLYIDIIAILVIGILYIRKKPHYLYHRFQTLADCLRVQAYWKYAGMTDEVITNFRSHQIPEIDWLKIVLNGLEINTQQNPGNKNPRVDDKENNDGEISHLDKCWLENRIKKEFEPSLQAGIFNNLLMFFPIIIFPFILSFIPLLPFTLKHFIQYRNQIVDIIHYFTSLLSIIIYPLIKLLSFIINPLLSFVVTLLSFIINLKILLNPLFYVVLFLLILLLIYPYLSRIFRYLLQKVINKNILLIISLGFVIYFCFSGLFELIRLSSLCTNQSVDIANTSIDFMNVGELIRLIIQTFIAFVLIGFLYLKMHMFDKERKRMELLLPCFDVADRSIDIIISENDVKERIASRKNKENSDYISDAMGKIHDKLLKELENAPNEIKPQISEYLDNLQSNLREYLRSLSLKNINIRNNNTINNNVIAYEFNDDQIDKTIDNISSEIPSEEIKDLNFDKESIDNDLNINELVSSHLSEKDINNIFDKFRSGWYIPRFLSNYESIDKSIQKVRESIDRIKKDVENHVNNVITNQINNINSQIAKLNSDIDKITEIKSSIKNKVAAIKTTLEKKIKVIENDVNSQIDSFEENANENFKNYVYQKIEDINNTKAFSAEEFETQIDKINEFIVDKFKNKFDKIKSETLEKIKKITESDAKDEYLTHLLLELGQEVLAKRIDWLLDVNDRDLKSPK